MRESSAMTGERRGRIFYGWWVVAAGFGLEALIGSLFFYAYGAYVVLLREEFAGAGLCSPPASRCSAGGERGAGPRPGLAHRPLRAARAHPHRA